MYSAQLLDHFQNPRNTGEIPDADARAQMENPGCGDVIRLSLKFDGNRIVDIRFKAKGCVPAMACASVLTELVRGRTVQEAKLVRPDDVAAVVGELPTASAHAVQLALDALSAALDRIKNK